MRFLLLLVGLAACAGCANRDYVNLEGGPYNNLGAFMTFQHDFTDAAAENARRKAEGHCAESKRVAVMTRRVCTMKECTTDYQCMSEGAAARVAPADVKK